MTASLFTFTQFDGTVIEINSDRINFFKPSTVGNTAATIVNVDNIEFTVKNTLSTINSVLASTAVPLPISPPIVLVFPTVTGSAQFMPWLHDPEPYPYRTWTWPHDQNLLAGKDAIIRSSQEYPRIMAIFDPEPYSYRSWELSYNIHLMPGQDVLPFRNMDMPLQPSITLDYFFENSNTALGTP